jgi:L-ascorbate metabolism protein UlaG (beta-lactamase superfamily)
MILQKSVLLFIPCIFCFNSILYSQINNEITYIRNQQLKTILSSDQWQGNPIDKHKKFMNSEFPWKFTFGMKWKYLTESNPDKEAKKKDTFKLPVENDTSFLTNRNDVIVWLGHSSFYIRVNGISILTDPDFFKSGISKRKCPIPFDANLLRDINYILISHDHRDHLDKKSLKILFKNNKNPEILSGLRMDKLFDRMLKNPKVQTAGWYQQFETDTSKIKIYFMPARHWGKRGLWSNNEHLWGSFVIVSNGKKIFFSGDTGYGSHLKEVGELFNGIDICIIGIGAFKPEWLMSANHISPIDAVKASNEMEAKHFIPMHYGTFDFSQETLGEPQEILVHENQQGNLHAELDILPVGRNYYF